MMRGVKPAIVVLVAATFVTPVFAAERWWESYNKGVAAVRAKNYEAAADALQRAIAEMPVENGAARARSEIITYVPHFWLGIARFNLSDVDGALREWKTSEDQGVVQSTPYFAQLRDWEARAQSERNHRSETAAGDSKREANAAVGKAVSAQMDAVSAGADRSDAYRAGRRKLQEAMEANSKGGTEIRAYRKVAELAGQSRELFVNAAEEGRRQRASRPAAVARQNPPAAQPPIPAKAEPRPPVAVAVVAPQTAQPVPKSPPAAPSETTRGLPEPVVESAVLLSARTELQQYRRQLSELHLPVDEVQTLERSLASHPDPKTIRAVHERVAAKQQELTFRAAKAREIEVTAMRATPAGKRELESAYRAFAAGDLDVSEQQLSRMLAAKESAEAYLLRGCARYTQAMLSRNSDTLLGGAAADFRSALRLNRSMKLDRAAFSPKLVAYFEQVRKAS